MHIKTTIREFLNENLDSNLTLYHGSNNTELYDKFHDNQFFTTNDYIASNYAYNFGGLFYEVKVNALKPFELLAYHKTRDAEKYEETIALLRELYDEDVVYNYEQHYFTPSPSVTFMQYGWAPIIEWSKKNGYDSLKFIDESFDTYVHDTTYLIFDGNKAKIQGIFDIEDAVESNFSKDVPYKKLR
jgi:hypothetical protein